MKAWPGLIVFVKFLYGIGKILTKWWTIIVLEEIIKKVQDIDSLVYSYFQIFVRETSS